LLIDLVYELLDAHSDTVALASDLAEPAWEAHADYVRALQRRSREILAASALETGDTEPVLPTPAEDLRE
jgi:hypothetical protein